MSDRSKPSVATEVRGALKGRRDAAHSAVEFSATAELPVRLFIDRKSLRISAAAMAALMTFYPVLSFAQSVPAGVTRIVPDGRTATTVTANGSVSTVTTTTVSGANAFNSYSKFEIGAGNTGNLILPNGTSNLINLVNGNTATTINGTLNAYKNGQIGGNVYFADPNGFIVGKSGVVNVGSLNVTTPTREFMDSVIGAGGQINQGAVNNLLAGTVPLSPDGNIRIRGRINAVDAVRLTGQNVSIGSDASKRQANNFGSTVNSKGLRSADRIVVRNGSVQIVAANDAKINGGIAARRGGTVTVQAGKDVNIGANGKISVDSKNGDAGSIAVNAGRDIKIAGYGTLSAKSEQGKGGNIVVLAQGNLTVAANATFDASSAQSDAGFVELSARKTAAIDAIKLNLTAPNGVVGTLLIDPYDLTIGPGTTNGNSEVSASIQSYGANVRLTADNSITLATGYYIDSRDYNYLAGALSVTNASQRSSGSVTLEAPTITINGSIITNVINTGTTSYNAGDVTLTASVSKNISSSSHTAETSITIGATGNINATVGGNSSSTAALAGNISLAATSSSSNESGEVIANSKIDIYGTLTGRNVSAIATSTATASYGADALSTMALIGQTLAASLLGVNGGYVAGTTSAKVNVYDGANITATNDVTLKSQATEVAANPGMVISGAGAPWGASATVGLITADVLTNVAARAHITAGGKLTAQATNNATLGVSAIVVTTGGVVDGAVAVSKVRINTTANIESGAVLSLGSLDVLADNTNSFSTSATVAALGAGSVGAALAYADIASHATANLGASLTIASGNAANSSGIRVEAISETTKLSTSASVSVGTNGLQSGVIGAVVPDNLMSTVMSPMFGSALPVKIAGAVAYTASDQTATATIGNDSAPPTISTPGDVSVVARTIDSAIRTNADSGSTASAKDSTGTLVTANAAVSYGVYSHETSATIGHGVSVTARNIGVNAKTDLPNENEWVQNWTHWETPSDIFSHLNGNLGTVNNILTSYSNASGTGSQNLAVAGSVNLFSVNNETTAWVATDAHLTQTGSTGGWHTQLTNGDTIDWSAAVQVSATTSIQTIDVAGNFGALLTGTQGAGSGVGGSLNLVFQNNRTVAGIAAGAVVSSDDWVAVSAWTDNLFFAVAPTSGVASGSLALNGIVSYASLSDFTHASIDNNAKIRAPTVTVKATESVAVISVAGAVAQGAASAAGIANSVLDISGDTAAYIGINAADNANDTSVSSAAAASGFVHTDALSVQAVTTGELTSASVAAVLSDPASSLKSFGLQMADAIQNLNASVVAAVRKQAEGIETAGKAVEKTTKAKPPSFSIDLAGSTSVNLVDLDTKASITSAYDISKYSPSATVTTDVLVEALNNTIISAGSGSASFNFSGSSTSVAVAGAIALGILDNNTTASIFGSTITNAGQVTVRAMSAGSETLVGIGLAASAPTSTSGAASLSASIGIITDSVDASIKYSTITGNSAAPASDGQVVVQAYQQTDIGIGGGALYFAGSGGLGLAITYASIGDPSTSQAATNAAIYSTAITQVQNVTVAAGDTARIAAGAAAGGGGPDANGLAGAIVISYITNSTTASISADPQGPRTITVSGSVSVTADSAYNAALAALLTQALFGTNPSTTINTGIDFGGGELNGGVANSLGASIMAVAGLVQAGDNNVGASIVVNTISQTHSAVIEYAYLTAGATVTATATDATRIVGVAVGAGLSTGTFAGVASIVTNQISSQMLARIGTSSDPADDDRTRIQANDVNVRALNISTARGGAGTLGIGTGNAAVGLSVVTNKIGDNVTAIIAGGRVYVNHDINVQAASTANILTVAIGIAVAETVGIAGSIATSLASTNITASIDNADVKAQNNVGVLAQNDDNIAVMAGATGIGMNAAGIGLSVVVNEISGSTVTNISNSTVDAFGAGSGTLTVNTGTLNNNIVLNNDSASSLVPPGLSEQTQSVQGLAVVATSHQTVTANALTLGIALEIISAGIAVVPVTNVMGGLTSSTISNSLIDTRLTGTNAPQVVVTASSKSFAGNSIVAGGVGGFGGAAANASNQMDRTTIASISGTNIGTTSAGYTGDGPSVAVTAKATQAAADKVVGFAVGIGGGAAASGVINVFSADTEAFVDRGIINAKQLQVTADSTNAFYAVAGAGAAGIGIGIAAAYAISDSENTTVAYVGDNNNVTTINLKGRLAINAVSTNTFDSMSVGGALAGGEGYAGMVNAIAMGNVTRAGLYRANVTTLSTATQSDTDANGGAVSNPAGVQITATENITVRPLTGSGAVGFQGEGEGSATNVVALGSQVVAESVNSQINVPGAVVINAVSNKTIDAQTFTFGAGSSRGVGAAVGSIVIGNSISAEAMDLLDHNGSGTLSKLNAMSGGGQNYVLSTSGIAAYQAAANASLGHTASAQEVQDYAKGLYTTLLQNGTPGSSGFVLSTSGIARYASSALSGTTLTNYNALVAAANGAVQNGVFVLTAAGITTYQAAANTALGHTATTAEVQAYANGLYQGYVASINTWANTQYQTFASNGIHYVLDAAGIQAMRSEAQTALGRTGLSDLEIQVYANDRYTRLTADGTVSAGRLTLSSSSFGNYVQGALSSADYTTYQSLTAAANGAISNGTLTLNATGLGVFRAAATASLGHAATDPEVQTYANSQYQTLTNAVNDYANNQYQFLVGNQDTTTAAQSFSVSGALSNVNDGVIASLTGGTTTATAVAVSATSKASTTNMATGVGAGIGYGVGAAVAYTEIGSTVAATISQGTVNATTVTATATVADGTAPTATVKSYAGAGAMTAAVGASRSDAHIDNAVTASLGGTINLTSSGTATATALDTSSVRSDAFGATEAGVVGIGISLADATKTSIVAATMIASSSIAGGTAATFNAGNSGAVYAGAVAGAGGLVGAGVGAQASATDTSSVTSKVGAGSTINVGTATTNSDGTVTLTGTVTLAATDVPDAKALALGVGVAIGAAVGTSIAEATANPTVLAQIDNSVDAAHATTITAGALNITATGTYNGSTPATDIPTSASTPSSTADFQAGASNAAAWSVAGSGGYFIAAQGTVATANDNASVTANIGNFTKVTRGTIGVKANNTTVEVAYGLGVAVGGYLSIGVVVVNANANTNTSATVGNDVQFGLAPVVNNGVVVTPEQYTGALTVAATGKDYSTARSTAGSGGTLAGSGATGQTDQDSTVVASIGDRGVLYIASLALTGVHTDNYKSIVDSTQAATLGASGATSENHADSTINVGIGQATTIFASAPTAEGMCDVQACAPGITILAQNKFNENGTQDSARAAGGGGVNGAGATSALTITGSANITFGTNSWIFSGADPISSPGDISILATSMLTGTDSASLETGGVIQGAGVRSQLNATLGNNITINNGAVMKSYGTVSIGTYTNSTAGTQALVSTWGAAAVGVADAWTSVTTNQNVTVGNASIFGFGNVYVTAGRYGFGYYDTVLNGGSQAHGYVRGLIAVPDATATTFFTNAANMSLASGGNLWSAQDVYVGGYTGTLSPVADSAGHGYELGFIPVTKSSDVTNQTGTATVELNGNIIAGYYHDLNIVISCNNAASCLTQTSGLPVTVTYTPLFNAAQYVNDHFDATVAPVLLGGISSTPVPAFLLAQMYAAGGNVTINASRDGLLGTGTVTAYGSPTITVTNNSSAYLVLAGGAYIPDTTGGQILFTGANGSANALHVNARPGTVSAITVNNAFNDGGTTGPAILVAGDITNLGGVVSISNTLGSYGQTANLSAQQLNVYVPNGAVAVSANDPSGMYIAGGFPSTEWDAYMDYPGGKTITTNSARIAAQYLANVFYQQRIGNAGNQDDLNRYLYGREDDSNIANRNPSMSRVSEIFLGACAPYTDHCQDGSSEYYFAGSNFFQNIQYYSLSKTGSFSNANLSGSQNSYQIYGGQVAIKATIININATIVAGRNTDYNINLSSSLADPLITTVTQVNSGYNNCFWCNPEDVVPVYQTTYSGGELALDRQNYITALQTNPGANPIYVVSGTGGLVTYNAATNQLIVASINASSGGGNILLDGKVVSTNTVGRIHLNGGYGNVQINNQTGVDLVLNNINTGNALASSALTSTVKIVDRLNTAANNTTVYSYTPGVGIKIYQTANGTDPLAGAAYTLVQSDSTQFNPIVGTRYQWVMQATLERTVDPAANTIPTDWHFTSGSANAPWVFVKSEYINADGSLNMSAASHLSTSPQGILINDTSLTSVAFKETITGGVSGIAQVNVAYHGCGGDVGSECHYGFIQNGSDYGDWNYNFVTAGWLKLTSSVKADNPIAIDFGGNASGRVNVNSNSNIIVAGTLTNPSGTATLTATKGTQTVFNQTASTITQTSSNPILTTNLNLVAADGIGTAAKPINATITANSGGTLNAQTTAGDIYMNLNSDARIGLVWAGDPQNGFKDVNIIASGSLTRGAVPQDYAGSAGSDINIRARNINLTSTGGSIGSITDPLKISANATALSSGGVDGGIVNIVANGDIGITQVAANSNYSGDLRVGLIASNSGDVLINVPGGNIYDASGQTAAQALTAAQVDAISQALHLTPLDGAQASALATVTAFDNLMNKAIADYSRIFNKGTKQTGTFALTTATTEIFRPAVSAALGHTATDAEVQAWANTNLGVFVLDANALDSFRPLVTAALGLTGRAATDTEVQAWANAKYNAAVPTFYQAYGTGFANSAALTNALANYAAYAALNGSGSVQNGTFVLTGSGLLSYSVAALGTNSNATFQALMSNGSLQNGVFVLSSAGIATFSQTALSSTNYAALQLLQTSGAVQNGVYALTASGLLAVAPTALTSGNYTTFQQLTASANSFMQAGVFTLTPAGITAFRAAATTALGHAASDAEVQTYASGQYQTLADSVRTYASTRYQTLTSQVQDYANTQYTTLASQIQTYANTQFTSLKSTVVYSATPSVALMLLNTSGSVVNGSFVLSATGVLSYASSALSAANYQAFRAMMSNGSVQGGTFLLNQTGLMNTAQAALTVDYQNFQSLVLAANGSVASASDGTLTLTLTAAGIAAFRAAATASLGHAASDAEVQAYANGQYQAYVTTIRGNASTQYQGYAATIQAAANTQYQTYAQQIRAYYSGSTLADADIPILAQYALSGSTLAAFQSLYAKGTVTGGVFTLLAANIPTVASTVLGAADYTKFQSLYAQGSLAGGIFKLSAAGVAAQAGTVLTPTYQSFLALGASGAVQYGSYQFNNAGITTYAQSGLTASSQTFQSLLANGSVVNGTFVLTSSGIANMRSAAAAAMGISNPTDAQVQAYASAQYQSSLYAQANTQYQGYQQTIASSASAQYQAYLQTIRAYINEHPGGPFNGQQNDPNDLTSINNNAQNALGWEAYQNYLALTQNGTVNSTTFVYTLNSGVTAAGAVAQLVLPTATYNSYTSLLQKGTVQNGTFLLSSANVYQAFQQLTANGTFTNGAFNFTGAGVQANAQNVLTSAFQQLTGYGAVQGNVFVLSGNGVAYYAPAALSAVNYATYVGLTSAANGTVVNGTLTLNANGLAAFRQVVAAALNISSPTDAQVQAYANSQYQAFTQTIQTYGNTQYQANATQTQTYANAQYQGYAQTIAQYIQNQNGCFLCGGNNGQPPTDAQIAQNAQQALSSADYANFQTLLANGAVTNGTLVLSAAGLKNYATATGAQNYNTFQSLTANGTLAANGSLVLNNAGRLIYAQAALDAASYQTWLNLRQSITYNYPLYGTDATTFATLNARIDSYANTTYQADLQTIQGYASAQYQTYAQAIQGYGASQYNSITVQIQTFANTQYQADVQTIQAYGAAQYQTLNAAGTTPPPAGVQALVANFGWSTAQLASAIDRSALQPATTTIGQGIANIVGRDVTLNTSGSVGTLAPSVLIDLNDLRNGTISDAQRAALAIATTPGSVTFQGTDSNGQLVTGLVLSNLSQDQINRLTKAELKQTSPVFVNASGKFSATAGTAVYLQSTTTLPDNAPDVLSAGRGAGGTLTVGQIVAGGDVTLQAPQSILVATSAGNPVYAVQIINSGNLTLAATQNIGSAANALTFRTTGNLVAASAGTGDLYLNSVGSGLNIGRVNAQGTASITSSGNIAGYLPGIVITANSVVLNSLGDVGSSASPLSIKVGLGGNLSGTVLGSAYIYDVAAVDAANPAQLVRDLTVGAFSAATGLYLTAEGSIIIATSAASANGPVNMTADTIVMNAGSQITSGGRVTLAAASDLTLAHVVSTYNPASATVVVALSAGGSILSGDSTQTNVVANTANGLVSLVAFTNIGSLTHRVSFNAGSLSATASNGNIAIAGATLLHATLLSALRGNVDVAGNGVVTLDSVLAGTAANVTGTFTANVAGALNLGTVTSSGSQLVEADGDIVFTTLTANGSTTDVGDISVTSNAGKVQGTSLTAHRSATLNAATTNKGTTLTATNGSVGLSAGGLIDWATLNAATTVNVASTAGGVTLGTAISGGTQTINAAQTATFSQLTTNGIAGDAGDVLVTAGSIQGGSIAPAGLARLTATGAIAGTGSIVSTQLIALTAGGQIDWATLDGKTVTVDSTGGSATVGNVTSRGTLTLLAKQDVGFTQLTTTGLAGDPSDVIVTTGEGAILGGSITSHGKVALTAGADLASNSPNLANAKITSTGSITSATLIALNARGSIDWETLNAATTIDVNSTDGGARVGTATTVGSITMQGKQDVAFDQLTNTAAPGQGDVTLTSYNGSILGGSITSEGSVSLIAEGSINATGATASGGQLNWSVLRAGGNMFLRSLGDAITIDDAESGGTLTLWAKYNVTFRQLTTTGANSNIVLRSDEGAIIALGTGLVNVDAGGSVTMNAATTITGAEVRAGGSVQMTATNGRIGWNAVTAGTTVDVRSSADVIDIATIASGGAQTLWAKNNVTFSQLTATAGGADITSDTGAIVGGSVSLAGATRMAAKTTISGTTATSTAGAMEMTAEDMITWNAVNAAGGSLTITSTHRTMDIPSLASGGTMTLDVAQDMAITQIATTGIPNDAGDVNVTSHTGRITGGTIAANGGVTLNAPVSITGVSATGATGAVVMNTNGLIDWSTLNAGTQINLRSVAAGVNLGTATSGGTQTIRAAQDVTFNRLATSGVTGDAGDINVTSDTTKIEGPTVAANGSATLIAATTNKGTALTAGTGSATLRAGGLIDWATLNAGTQIDIRSTGANVNLGTATSGGTQTIRAAQDVNFATLTTNGIFGDAGDVTVTAGAGLIQGTTVDAHGSALLTAATTNKGTTLTARTGAATLLAGGLIDWTNINAGTSITASSTGGAINLGTATSGGSQTLHALAGVTFAKLVTTGVSGDLGNVAVTSDQGSIRGTTVVANGDASFEGGISIDLGNLTAGSVGLSTPQDLSIGFLQVYRSIALAADTINVKAEQLQSNPPVPLHVTVTGYRGGVATSANLTIDPPEVVVDKLAVTDVVLSVDSPKLTISDGYVPGQLALSTPAGDILMDNRSPAPAGGVNLQLYQPGGVFTLKQFGNANFTNTYVVYYDSTISSTIMRDGGADNGTSFVRDIPQALRDGERYDFAGVEKNGLATFYLLGLPGGWRIDAARVPLPVEAVGDGPAVNIDGLPEAKKWHQTRDRKPARNRIRSTALEQRDGAGLDLASAR